MLIDKKMLFEVYSQQPVLTKEIWYKFIYKLFKRISWFESFELDVRIEQPKIKFFLNSKRDFTLLGSDLYPFLLKEEPITEDDKYPKNTSRLLFFKIKAEENLLQLKEREEFKKGRKLFRVVFKFNKRFGMMFCKAKFYFEDGFGKIQVANKSYGIVAAFSILAIDFTQNVNFKLKTVPLYVKLQKTAHLFEEKKENAFLEVLGFPYIPKPEYLPITSFDFSKHSLIVGQTGTGKSKMIELFVKQLIKYNLTDEYAVVILDPHASIYSEFVTEAANIDFFRNSCSLFSTSTDVNISTELTILLFKTVVKDQFNPKMERVLKYTLHVLYQTKEMAIDTLQKFLTELEFRKEILQKLGPGQEQFIEFFDTDFVELQTKFYEQSIMPIILLLDELRFLPFANQQSHSPIENFVNDNNITFLSLNKIMIGEKATKLLAGLLIQQIFTLAQARAFKKKLIFIIDEVSIVENDSLGAILSEARKYDLSLFLTQQYLTQVDEKLLKSILTNVYNYYVFKVAEEDASLLAKNLEIEFPDEILTDYKEKGFKEEDLKVKMFSQLDPRQCLVRLYSGGQFLPCFKARTMDIVGESKPAASEILENRPELNQIKPEQIPGSKPEPAVDMTKAVADTFSKMTTIQNTSEPVFTSLEQITQIQPSATVTTSVENTQVPQAEEIYKPVENNLFNQTNPVVGTVNNTGKTKPLGPQQEI